MSVNHTLYTRIRASAKEHKSKTAIVFYGKRLSFRRLLRLIDQFACGLWSIGIRRGDVVSVCLPNTPSAVIAFYAINKIGAIANLLHPYVTASELTKNMQMLNSRVLIAYDMYIDKNQKSLMDDITLICSSSGEFMSFVGKMYYSFTTKVKIDVKTIRFKSLLLFARRGIKPYSFTDEEPAVYLPSGGTTGEPKVIMHNCRALNDLAGKAQFFLSQDISKYKSIYSVLPIFHGFGLCMNMHLAMVNGVTNVMCIKFSPTHMAKAIPKEKVAVLTGVPAMYLKLLDNKEFQKADLSSIRECFVGGDSAPQVLIEDFNRLLRRCGSRGALYVGYGLTETVTVCAVTCKKHNRPRSVGYPLPGTRVVIIKNNRVLAPGEIGEICINTPIIMLGYYNSSDTPIKKIGGVDWLFTGDFGYMDQDGFIYFKQRIKNTIKVSGIPVFPSEVEELVEKVNGVKRVAAVGVKDLERGEVVKVIVEPEMGADISVIKREIAAICNKELIVYAQPRKIEFRDKLPVSAMGKIDRSKLQTTDSDMGKINEDEENEKRRRRRRSGYANSR